MTQEELTAIEARAANSMNGDYHADALALVAEVRRLRESQQWRTMDSAPKDGSRFLAETLTVADEYDEYDRLLKKGVRTRDIVVAYYLFGGFVSYPFNGAVPMNVYYTAWQPLPTPQVQS